MSETETQAKPCPNCGHCPTCGHTPQPRAIHVAGQYCGSCGAWFYGGVHVCPFQTFNPYWQIPWTTTGSGTLNAPPTDYVLMNSTGGE